MSGIRVSNIPKAIQTTSMVDLPANPEGWMPNVSGIIAGHDAFFAEQVSWLESPIKCPMTEDSVIRNPKLQTMIEREYSHTSYSNITFTCVIF